MAEFAKLAAKARRSLMRRDPVLREVIRRVGPCTLEPAGTGFHILARAIVSQLISTKAARTISGRIEAAAGADANTTFIQDGKAAAAAAGSPHSATITAGTWLGGGFRPAHPPPLLDLAPDLRISRG